MTNAKTVMIVDDSEFMREYLVEYFKKEGYNILAANDGLDALGVLDQSGIKADMIITDLNMPKMNGIELIRQLRKAPMYLTVPMVLITSDFLDLKKCEVKGAGVNEWIQKPFSPKLLKETVNKLLK